MWENRGHRPDEFLSWLYDHPGQPVEDFLVEDYERCRPSIHPDLVIGTSPTYETLDWDDALDELRAADLITGEPWSDPDRAPGGERFYPQIPTCKVELTAAGRAWVERRRAPKG